MTDMPDRNTPSTARRRQPRSDIDRTAGTRSRAHDETDTMDRPFMDRWKPPVGLEVPPDDGEYTFRWVAEYVNGEAVPQNVQKRLREGYVRVNIAELPDDLFMAVDEDKGDGIARTGGLILMKMPIALRKQREAYYRNKSLAASRAVDVLQGVAGKDAVYEDRGTRQLAGADAAQMLHKMSQR